STILQDLDAALDLVDADIEEPANGGSADLQVVATAFREAVDSSGLRVVTGHGDPVLALLAALVTKPFVILSGMSGSGKTQLALRLGEWFGSGPSGRRFLPVPVRPDWTGPEALFGYEDALRPAVAGKAAWFVPSTLEFLLAAAAEPDMPYLLLLDEMNLAHVERYFSDFLSGVESRDAVLPNLSRGADGEWRLMSDSEPRVPLPRNVFVIGTVNVDETTYQFSPKVLDRATTFEVRTSTDELLDEAVRPAAIPPADSQLLKVLVDRVLDDSWQQAAPVLPALGMALRDLHSRLSETGDEFGHRVFYESRRFAVALNELGVADRDALLDHILMLKILPRVHGSRRRAEPVLKSLLAFGMDPDAPRDRELATDGAGKLPMSVNKVRRMLRTLEMNQFVSFTD
ncbi:MAG: GTPase subunit of restriction endonuclease-like protein, partial [Chthonomonadaceae bacterium]|nr:GTPase subunit of restriction endonuclease-like protein [Chthonomonadaceae bacterium]